MDIYEITEEAIEILHKDIFPSLPKDIRDRLIDILDDVVLCDSLFGETCAISTINGLVTIQYNVDWLDDYVRSPVDMAGFLLHELLHVALDQLSSKETVIKNLSYDCVVQSIIRSCETANDKTLGMMDPFRRYYYDDPSLTVLCYPPPLFKDEAETYLNKLEKDYIPEIVDLYKQIYPDKKTSSKLYETDITKLKADEIYSVLNKYSSYFIGFDDFFYEE